MALTNNIGYQQQNEVTYGDDKYFKITSTDEVDYRAAYGEGPTNTGNDSCHEAFFASSGKKVIKGNPNLYWLIDNEIIKLDNIPDSISFTVSANCNIIAPTRCKIMSSSKTPSKTNDITLQCQVDSNSYTIKCENLERWWCCYGRTSAADVKGDIPTWEHTCTDSLNRIIQSGQVIGRALGGKTVITISKSGGNMSDGIREFYRNTN